MDIKKVKDFWEQHLCNEFYTTKQRGDKDYFADIEKKRYFYHYHLRELFEYFKRNPEKFKDKSMLEIGCGMGMDSVQLYNCGFKLTSIDITEIAIKIAKQRAKKENLKINFMLGNAEELEFKNEQFDFVWSNGVLHHTPRIKQAVDEVYRVLKKGGTAYIMLYAKYSLVNFVHKLFNIPYEMPKDMKDHCPVVYTFSKKEIRGLFSRFNVVRASKEYPFTYGFRHISMVCPLFLKKWIGKVIGWHYMIKVIK
ncbi:class I SAM-dependent methyltransferase [Candidatus Woesearchaeota archaeon]|nr:class I SAM-dependent methyltransferase [Candidatus Woesearchaeota archaeon]